MRLKRLKLKNIRSYRDEEIVFPEGSLLLSGDVGSGKTSILLAIEYALFGLQPGQRGSVLLRNNASNGEVSLEFEIDGAEVIIERKLRRNSKTVVNDYAAITIDGEKTESSITEIKTKILSLLQYPAEFVKKTNLLYRFTVYTPQEEMKQIILEDSEARLNILRHVFGVDKYKRIRENVSILTTKYKEESKVLQGEIKDLEQEKSRMDSMKNLSKELDGKIILKQNELAENVKKRKEIEFEAIQIEKKIKEKESFEREIEKTKIMIGSKKEQLLIANREYAEISKRISEAIFVFDEKEFIKIIEEIALKKRGIEYWNDKYIEVTSKIKSLNLKVEDVAGKRNRIFKIDMCPVCLQNVPESHKHNILNDTDSELSRIGKEVYDLDLAKKQTYEMLEKQKRELNDFENKKRDAEIIKIRLEEIEKSKKRLNDISKNRENLENDVNLLARHAESLKESAFEFSKFDNVAKAKQEELKNAFVKEKGSEISLAELKKELELTQNDMARLEIEIGKKELTKKKLSEILEINDWLANSFLNLVSYTERNIMIKLRQEFSKLFSKWFDMITNESFEVRLDENFTPIIMQGEYEMDYSYLSGGERTAVALAYRLALNQTINSVLSRIKTRDIVILDEPTDGFSDAQLDKIRDVLNELDVGQLIIVSHEQKIESFVDSVLRLKKIGGISAREEGMKIEGR